MCEPRFAAPWHRGRKADRWNTVDAAQNLCRRRAQRMTNDKSRPQRPKFISDCRCVTCKAFVPNRISGSFSHRIPRNFLPARHQIGLGIIHQFIAARNDQCVVSQQKCLNVTLTYIQTNGRQMCASLIAVFNKPSGVHQIHISHLSTSTNCPKVNRSVENVESGILHLCWNIGNVQTVYRAWSVTCSLPSLPNGPIYII